jgi:hypothetical protein
MNIKKLKKNIITSNVLDAAIVIILILSLINQTNFFKEIYMMTNKYNYAERFQKSYGYCGKDSIGYVNYINNKFHLKEKPTIFNYSTRPDVSWVFFNVNLKKSDNKSIILNYNQKLVLSFSKLNNKKNYYVASSIISNASEIENIIINSKYDIKFNGKITVLKMPVGSYSADIEKLKKKIDLTKSKAIYVKNFQEDEIKNNIIKINKLINNINSGNELNLIFIETEDQKALNFIDSFTMNLKNTIDINKYKILDNYNNLCFFLEKKND